MRAMELKAITYGGDTDVKVDSPSENEKDARNDVPLELGYHCIYAMMVGNLLARCSNTIGS